MYFFKWNSTGNQCRDSDFDRFDRKKQPRAGAAKTLNEQLRSQRANIDALSSAYATQRKMTHDFRHHIAALSGMLQGGETQQAQDYLAALQEQQTERALMVNTHNSAIDAVLNQRAMPLRSSISIFSLKSTTCRPCRSN